MDFDDQFWLDLNQSFRSFNNYLNDTNFLSGNDPDSDYWSQLTVTQILGIICAIGLIGNSFLIYTAARSRFQFGFSKSINLTVLCLTVISLVDFIAHLGVPFLLYTNSEEVHDWSFGNFGCKAVVLSIEITRGVSPVIIVILAVTRYIAVCHPKTERKWRLGRFVAVLIFLISWPLPAYILYVSGRYSFVKDLDYTTVKSVCITFLPERGVLTLKFLSTLKLLEFSVSFVIVILFNALTIRRIGPVFGHIISKFRFRSSKSSNYSDAGSTIPYADLNESLTNAEFENGRQLTTCVLVITSLHFLLLLPFLFLEVLLDYEIVDLYDHSEFYDKFFIVSNVLFRLSSTVNPILCFFLCDDFRARFLDAFTRRCRKQPSAIPADYEAVSMADLGKPDEESGTYAVLHV